MSWWSVFSLAALALLSFGSASPAFAEGSKGGSTKPTGKVSTAKSAAPFAVLVQESNGFPGGEKTTALSKQWVTVQGKRMQVLDPAHLWAMYVDLGTQRVQEADLKSKQYVQRPFSYYAKYRKQRRETLADQKQEFLRRLKRLDGKRQKIREWKAHYRKIGGDPENPGKIVALLQHYPHDAKDVTLKVDRVDTKVRLEHYVIRENQAHKPVFDLWVTTQITLPVDLKRFYRELGTFSAPVSAKLAELKGAIIDCTAVLDTGSFRRVFRSRVLEVRLKEPPRVPPVLPKSFTLKPAKKAPAETKTTTKPCALCGKQVEPKKAVRFREPWGKRRRFLTCDTQCRRKLIKKLIRERKR